MQTFPSSERRLIDGFCGICHLSAVAVVQQQQQTVVCYRHQISSRQLHVPTSKKDLTARGIYLPGPGGGGGPGERNYRQMPRNPLKSNFPDDLKRFALVSKMYYYSLPLLLAVFSNSKKCTLNKFKVRIFLFREPRSYVCEAEFRIFETSCPLLLGPFSLVVLHILLKQDLNFLFCCTYDSVFDSFNLDRHHYRQSFTVTKFSCHGHFKYVPEPMLSVS